MVKITDFPYEIEDKTSAAVDIGGLLTFEHPNVAKHFSFGTAHIDSSLKVLIC